jgi:hypothetical protein
MTAPRLVCVRVEAHPADDIPPTTSAATQGGSRARRFLVLGATIVAAGIASVGTSHPDVGGPLLMTGWVVLAAGIHRFGRSA